ncbi:hypothetical protein [Micromonospora tulbaghiae]|uniref:hypothetical protein n=1 Tax=Micromonospora tulbaghiae TaxID=479978 RepID=UPI003EB91A40
MLHLPSDNLPTDHRNGDLTGRRTDPAAHICEANGSRLAPSEALAPPVGTSVSDTDLGADGNRAAQR